jgi:hypothetical protein
LQHQVHEKRNNDGRRSGAERPEETIDLKSHTHGCQVPTFFSFLFYLVAKAKNGACHVPRQVTRMWDKDH